MPSTPKAYWLRAVTLAMLVLLVSGFPVSDSPGQSLDDEPSGDEEKAAATSDLLSASPVWDLIISATKRHEKEFKEEFKNNVEYHSLQHYSISSLPKGCPSSNFSKEACLLRLAQGLHIYRSLLKHVEKEVPYSRIFSGTSYPCSLLINLIKENMKKPHQVSALDSSQEEQLLKELDDSDAFHRKMKAHSILRGLHIFLVDGKRAVTRREMARRNRTSRTAAPIPSASE